MSFEELEAMQDFQIDEDALEMLEGSWSKGPVKITWDFNLAKLEFTFKVYLCGIKIGGGTLSPSNSKICVGGKVMGTGAKVCLELDVPNKRVLYEIWVWTPFKNWHWKGILFSW
jgi:hypothetical protein